MSTERRIAGACPLGCGETLFVGEGGNITCSFAECPDPTAAAGLLSPAAAEQRQAEETAITSRLAVAEKHRDALEREVAILLAALKGSWWLEAAAAFNRLTELTTTSPE